MTNTDSRIKPARASFRRGRMLAVAATVALAMAGPGAQAQARDPKAILKAMSDYVGRQPTVGLSFDSDIEVITPQMEKIQFTNSGDILLSRPNKLRAHRVGGYADVALNYDGNTVGIVSKGSNSYAQFEAPGTVDELIVALREGHGIALPGGDLLLSNSYEHLAADIMEAKHIGQGVVDGRACDHLAFRNFDTDWQLWVEVGERPIPCKLVITSKTMAGAPQYTIRVTNWKTDPRIARDAFAFVPPAGAQKLQPDQLGGFDELPPGVPAGEGK
ncbi:DUF2092 domain-containing protein [Variovorax humicola]|uniref:DUF2092 domain-containing protein n=1 Tax=Variovorax humicola TaxID=1769758 RepID=A0ABU8VWJ0_9BURK